MKNPKVVILCMENRSFDAYFGTFPGAIGFHDPKGADVFQQPHIRDDGERQVVRPFRASTFAAQIATDPNHSWAGAQTAWGRGKMDGWSAAQVSAFFTSMSYYAGNDIPYHWQLAEAFLLCDTYSCSVLGPTWPNRLFLMSGTIFPSQPHPGTVVTFESGKDLPALDSRNSARFPWKSYAAMLPNDTTWTLYDDQQWQPDWMSWPQAQRPPSYLHDSWLQPWDLNMFAGLLDAADKHGGDGTATGPSRYYSPTPTVASQTTFEFAARHGHLPDISWIVPPFYCTEHPAFLPADGECYLSRVVDAVLHSPHWDDPGIVLIITYDENGGFFDHVVPRTSREFDAKDEAWVQQVQGEAGEIAGPVGGGFRVPTIIVSPWTVRAGLSSKVAPDHAFDHTSVIQYLEHLTGKQCDHLPKDCWRRRTFASLCELIDTKKAPVPASEVRIASPSEVDAWRIDVLTRLYGGDTHDHTTPVLPAPWPEPTQSWPPLEQTCRIVVGQTNLAQAEVLREGAASIACPDVCWFVVDGFVPGELNLGKFVPAGFEKVKPRVEATIFPTKDCTPGTQIGSVPAHVGDAVPGDADPAVPRTFSFPCSLELPGGPMNFPVWIEFSGSFTSRLTWTARAVIRVSIG